MSEITTTTTERIYAQVPDISPDVVADVAESAEIAARIGFTALFEAANTDGPKVIEYGGCPKVEILDMAPLSPDETGKVLLYFLPMARDFDQAEVRRLVRLKLMLSDTRVIAVASPSGWRCETGRLSLKQFLNVWSGDITPLLASVFHYLRQQRVPCADIVGNSYGGHEALAAAAYAAKHRIFTVGRVVDIEPPDVIERSFPDLARSFLSTHEQVPHHKQLLTDPEFATGLEKQPSLLRYIFNLTSPTNLAIANSIRRGRFAEHIRTLLTHAPDATVNVAIGSASELAPCEATQDTVDTLAGEFPGRIGMLVVKNMPHACYLDVDLTNGVTLDGLRRVWGKQTLAYRPALASA